MKRITRAKRKNYQQAINPELRQRRLNKYRETKGVYSVKIEETKEEILGEVCDRNPGCRSMETPYKVISKKIKNPNVISTMQKDDGSFMETWDKSLQVLMNRLLADDVMENGDDLHKEIREGSRHPQEINSDARIEMQVSNEELEGIVKELRRSKATGPDCVRSEIHVCQDFIVNTLSKNASQ